MKYLCPMCNSDNVSTERRIDGFSSCANCYYKARTERFKKVDDFSCKEIGTPQTIGEFRKLTKDYLADTEFGFRNQPMQSLYELTEQDGKVSVVFQ